MPAACNHKEVILATECNSILLTGFMPFGCHDSNPSQLVLERLGSRSSPRCRTLLLPVCFDEAAALLERTLRDARFDIVLSLGLAGGRRSLDVERVAINVADAPIPDNAGARPIDRPIDADGPAAYFSTLPVKAMVRAARDAGIDATLSNTAGTYVCNRLFYGALHFASLHQPSLRAGFVHLPAAEIMELATAARGIAAMLDCLAEGGHTQRPEPALGALS